MTVIVRTFAGAFTGPTVLLEEELGFWVELSLFVEVEGPL